MGIRIIIRTFLKSMENMTNFGLTKKFGQKPGICVLFKS